ncbi:MAG: PAS domain-containing sensor histidine kinase, partial [Methanospirillum sp.]|uniref:PAS domain-containing sensor histidine kinase n=1 Tax=Methanospirillum sp. TaxID=45200 RepID=UPI00236AD31E
GLDKILIPDISEMAGMSSRVDAHVSVTDYVHTHLCNHAKKFEMYASCPFPLVDENGKTIGYMCFFNTSEIPADEQRLMINLVHTTSHIINAAATFSSYQEINENYQTLVDNIPHGFFFKDPSLRYIACNRQYADNIGKKREEILGKTDYDLFSGATAEISSRIDQELIVSGETREKVFELIEENKTRWIESILTPIKDNNGHIAGILGISRDITEMKLSQEKMQCLYNELEVITEARTEELFRTQEAYSQANNKLNLLNSVTRHDILNQINALYGYLELIKESVSDIGISQYLQKIEQSAEAIQEQILFTRIYQDIGVFSPVWQSVLAVVDRILTGFKTGTIRFLISLNPVEVYADPLLEKVFYTLVDNSIRHGKTVTTITIRDEIVDDTLVIRYEDDGIGILPEEKDHIFERGYGHNTGLGLFLAREILQITSLSIRESGAQGNGTCFEITVPYNCYRHCSVQDPSAGLEND